MVSGVSTKNTPDIRRDKRIIVPLALAAIYAVALAGARLLYAPCDDTYIYLVYAKNYLSGHGLTYNGMSVQGFTSALWMWLIVLAGKTGLELPTAADALSAGSGAFVLVASWYLCVRLGLGWARSLAAPLLVATTGDFMFYMSNGLESVFFAGTLAWAVSYLFRESPEKALRSWSMPFVLWLCIVARPEGLIAAVLIYGVLFWDTRKPLLVLRSGIVLVALVLPVSIWTKTYYGGWLPNTYYAKTGAGFHNVPQGLTYLTNFAASIIPVVFLVLYTVIFRRATLRRGHAALAIIAAAWILNVTRQGGDNMVGFRALLPIIPILYALTLLMYRSLPGRQFAWGALVIAIFNTSIYGTGYVKGSSWDMSAVQQIEGWRTAHDVRVDIGRFLNSVLPKDATIAVNAAGVIPYFAERETIDMLGLNNAHIARSGRRDFSLPYGHQVGDGTYVLSQNPAVIVFTARRAGEVSPLFVSDQDIIATPEFRERYQLRPLPQDRQAFFRNDIAEAVFRRAGP